MRNALMALSGAAMLQAVANGAGDIIPTQETIQLAYVSAGALILATLAWAMRAHCRKVGGLTFLRVGRLSLSFCITKE